MVPLLIAALGVGAAVVAAKRKKKTPPRSPAPIPAVRQKQHQRAMTSEFRPNVLKKLANLFGSEGLNDQARELMAKAKQLDLQAKVIPELVERARAGDQNALAMIVAARSNAEEGLTRAQVTCQLIDQYCRKNPAQPRIGEEVLESAPQTATEAAMGVESAGVEPFPDQAA